MTTERVASANVKVTLTLSEARAALRSALLEADLIGIQEWGNGRNRILRSLGKLVRFPAVGRPLGNLPQRGRLFTRPLAGGPPVGLDATRYRLRSCRTRVLSGPSRVNPDPGNPRRFLGPSLATLLVAEDLHAGGVVALLNFHLTAGVQDRHGHYKPGKRAERHGRERARLRKIAARQRRRGRRVYLVGDTNYDDMKIPGLVSCWEGRDGVGTLGGRRAVDVVYAEQPAETVQLVRSPSDHDHPIATYVIEEKP